MDKSRIIRLNSFKKSVSVIALFGGVLLFPLLSTAQDSNIPCTGPNAFESTSTCPLDTWVWVLAALATIFAVFHLNRKNKSPLPNTEGIK
jgi:succinate dehydrogenase/fumarate reductase cytochrome b subunit